jgi:hypothetical protein
VDYEELPGPTEPSTIMSESTSKPVEKRKQVTFRDEPNATVGMGGSLKEGAYDEAESHNGFMEALNAWRNAGKPPGETPK